MIYTDTIKLPVSDFTPDDAARILKESGQLVLLLNQDMFALDALDAYITAVQEDGSYPAAVKAMEDQFTATYGFR